MKKSLFKNLVYSLVAFLLAVIPNVAGAVEKCTIQNLDCLKPTAPTFWVITGNAFVDSINPCAIAVLLLLLSALLFFNSRRKLFFAGLAFIIGIYITYFLFGVGIFYAIGANKWINPEIFHKIVGAFGIIMGLLNVKDFIWYGGGGFLMEIPRRWRPKMSLIIARATSWPVALITGALITFFELPCTGGPYIFTLGVLQNNGMSKILIAPILVYYNLIFVAPLLAILFGTYFGFVNIEKAESWKQRNIRALHLIAGIILVGLGIWVFLS
ncbi:MAG TPA: hypothetical protein P5096_01635 [Patescibacteria group bacterium]|nr:hypothetical protein [Patescibacteria group bacterium]